MARPHGAARRSLGLLLVLLLVATATSPAIVADDADDTDDADGGAVSLLPHLPTTAAERDQGRVPTCWVWAGTAALEIAHSVQDGVRDPLSVQYVVSNFNGGAGPGWAGNVGSVTDFVDFYREAGFAVPRSNANADYRDGACGARCKKEMRTSVPAASIATDPRYQITKISVREIDTSGTQEETIAAIKALIDRGTPVHLHLTWQNVIDIGAFQLFWAFNGDDAVYDPVMYAGPRVFNGLYHQMVVVGYDDTGLEDPYWLVLNSWGTTGGRPDGTFRMKMAIDYTSQAATWSVIDVTFGPLATDAKPAPAPAPAVASPPAGAGGWGFDLPDFAGLLDRL